MSHLDPSLQRYWVAFHHRPDACMAAPWTPDNAVGIVIYFTDDISDTTLNALSIEKFGGKKWVWGHFRPGPPEGANEDFFQFNDWWARREGAVWKGTSR